MRFQSAMSKKLERPLPSGLNITSREVSSRNKAGTKTGEGLEQSANRDRVDNYGLTANRPQKHALTQHREPHRQVSAPGGGHDQIGGVASV